MHRLRKFIQDQKSKNIALESTSQSGSNSNSNTEFTDFQSTEEQVKLDQINIKEYLNQLCKSYKSSSSVQKQYYYRKIIDLYIDVYYNQRSIFKILLDNRNFNSFLGKLMFDNLIVEFGVVVKNEGDLEPMKEFMESSDILAPLSVSETCIEKIYTFLFVKEIKTLDLILIFIQELQNLQLLNHSLSVFLLNIIRVFWLFSYKNHHEDYQLYHGMTLEEFLINILFHLCNIPSVIKELIISDNLIKIFLLPLVPSSNDTLHDQMLSIAITTIKHNMDGYMMKYLTSKSYINTILNIISKNIFIYSSCEIFDSLMLLLTVLQFSTQVSLDFMEMFNNNMGYNLLTTALIVLEEKNTSDVKKYISSLIGYIFEFAYLGREVLDIEPDLDNKHIPKKVPNLNLSLKISDMNMEDVMLNYPLNLFNYSEKENLKMLIRNSEAIQVLQNYFFRTANDSNKVLFLDGLARIYSSNPYNFYALQHLRTLSQLIESLKYESGLVANGIHSLLVFCVTQINVIPYYAICTLWSVMSELIAESRMDVLRDCFNTVIVFLKYDSSFNDILTDAGFLDGLIYFLRRYHKAVAQRLLADYQKKMHNLYSNINLPHNYKSKTLKFLNNMDISSTRFRSRLKSIQTSYIDALESENQNRQAMEAPWDENAQMVKDTRELKYNNAEIFNENGEVDASEFRSEKNEEDQLDHFDGDYFIDLFKSQIPDLMILLKLSEKIEPLEYNDAYRGVTELLTLLVITSYTNASKLCNSKTILMLHHLMQEESTRPGALSILVQLILNDPLQVNGNMANLIYILESCGDLNMHYDIMQALIFLFEKTPLCKDSFRDAKGFTMVISSLKLLKSKFSAKLKLQNEKEYNRNKDFLYLILATISSAVSTNRENRISIRLHNNWEYFNQLLTDTGLWETEPQLLIDWIFQLCSEKLVYVSPPKENVSSNMDDLDNAKAQFEEFERQQKNRLIEYQQGLHKFIDSWTSMQEGENFSSSISFLMKAINDYKDEFYGDLRPSWHEYLPSTQRPLLFHSEPISNFFEILPSSGCSDDENMRLDAETTLYLSNCSPEIRKYYLHLYIIFRCIDLICSHVANLESLSSVNIVFLCIEKWSSKLLDFQSVLYLPLSYLVEQLISYRPSSLDMNSYLRLFEPSKHVLSKLCYLSHTLLRVINLGMLRNAPFFYFEIGTLGHASMSCSIDSDFLPKHEGFTISAWIYVECFALHDIELFSISFANENNLSLLLKMGHLNINYTGMPPTILESISFISGKWYNVSIVHERHIFTNPETKIYINGDYQDSLKISLGPTNLTATKVTFGTVEENRHILKLNETAIWFLGPFLILDTSLNHLELNLLFYMGPRFYGSLLDSMKISLNTKPLSSKILTIYKSSKNLLNWEEFELSKIPLSKFKEEHIVLMVNSVNEVIQTHPSALNLPHLPYLRNPFGRCTTIQHRPEFQKIYSEKNSEFPNIEEEEKNSECPIEEKEEAEEFAENEKDIEEFEYIANLPLNTLSDTALNSSTITRSLVYFNGFSPIPCWPESFHRILYRKNELDMLLYIIEYVSTLYCSDKCELERKASAEETSKVKEGEDSSQVNESTPIPHPEVLIILLNVLNCISIIISDNFHARVVFGQKNGYSILASILRKHPSLITEKTLKLMFGLCTGNGTHNTPYTSEMKSKPSTLYLSEKDLQDYSEKISREMDFFGSTENPYSVSTTVLNNALAFRHFFQNYNIWIGTSLRLQKLVLDYIDSLIRNNEMFHYNLFRLNRIQMFRTLLDILLLDNVDFSLFPHIVGILSDIMSAKLLYKDLDSLCNFMVFTFTIECAEKERYSYLRNMLLNTLHYLISKNDLANRSLFEAVISPNWIFLFLSYEKNPNTVSIIVILLVHLCRNPSYLLKWQESNGFKYLSKILPNFHDYVPLYYILLFWFFGKDIEVLPKNLTQLDFLSLFENFKLSEPSHHSGGCKDALDLIVSMLSVSYLSVRKLTQPQSYFLWIDSILTDFKFIDKLVDDDNLESRDVSSSLKISENGQPFQQNIAKTIKRRISLPNKQFKPKMDSLWNALTSMNFSEIQPKLFQNPLTSRPQQGGTTAMPDYQKRWNFITPSELYVGNSEEMKNSLWPYKILFEFLKVSLIRKEINLANNTKKFNQIGALVSLIFPYSGIDLQLPDVSIWNIDESTFFSGPGPAEESSASIFFSSWANSVTARIRSFFSQKAMLEGNNCSHLRVYYESKKEEEEFFSSKIPPLNSVQIWNFYVLELITRIFIYYYFIYNSNQKDIGFLVEIIEVSPPAYVDEDDVKRYMYAFFKSLMFQLRTQLYEVIKEQTLRSLLKITRLLSQLYKYMIDHALTTLKDFPEFLGEIPEFIFSGIMNIKSRLFELDLGALPVKKVAKIHGGIIQLVRSLIRILLWRLIISDDKSKQDGGDKSGVIDLWTNWRSELLNNDVIDKESFSVFLSLINQLLRDYSEEIRIKVMNLWRHLLLSNIALLEGALNFKAKKMETINLVSGFNLLLEEYEVDGEQLPTSVGIGDEGGFERSSELNYAKETRWGYRPCSKFTQWYEQNLDSIELVFNEGVGKHAHLWWTQENKALKKRADNFNRNRSLRRTSLEKESIQSSSIMERFVNIDASLNEIKNAEFKTFKMFRKLWLEVEVYWNRKWDQRRMELFWELGIWSMIPSVDGPDFYFFNGVVFPRHPLQKWKLDETEGPSRIRKKFEVDYLFYRKYEFNQNYLCLADDGRVMNSYKLSQSLSSMGFMFLPRDMKFLIDRDYYIEYKMRHLSKKGEFVDVYDLELHFKRPESFTRSIVDEEGVSISDVAVSEKGVSISDVAAKEGSDEKVDFWEIVGDDGLNVEKKSASDESTHGLNVEKKSALDEKTRAAFGERLRQLTRRAEVLNRSNSYSFFQKEGLSRSMDVGESFSPRKFMLNKVKSYNTFPSILGEFPEYDTVLARLRSKGVEDGEGGMEWTASVIDKSSINEEVLASAERTFDGDGLDSGSKSSRPPSLEVENAFVEYRDYSENNTPENTAVVNRENQLEVQEGEELSEEKDDQLKYFLIPNEKPLHIYNCSRVVGLGMVYGIFLVCQTSAYFVEGYTFKDGEIGKVQVEERSDLKANTADRWGQESTLSIRWLYVEIRFFQKKRYLLRPTAIEIFRMDGRNYLLVFEQSECDTVLKDMSKCCQSMDKWSEEVQGNLTIKTLREKTNLWVGGSMSNFDYLMYLNMYAGRSYNDVTQYPVFPWVLSDYSSEELDLNDLNVYRDLGKPMGALGELRASFFRERFEMMDDSKPKFFYGSHYSQAAIVLQYLIRLEPFTSQFLELQGGRWDEPDRIFHSIEVSWKNSSENDPTDVRELIPEFFYLPHFLVNDNNYVFGSSQVGTEEGSKSSSSMVIDDVILPPWARGDPVFFVRKNRQALESPYVSENLHKWIDLIFGYKQRGKAALEAMNLFFYLTYEGAQDFSTEDPVEKQAILDQIHHFGQTPIQLFNQPHPKRQVIPRLVSGLLGVTIADEKKLGGCSFILPLKSVRVSQTLVPTKIKMKDSVMDRAYSLYISSNHRIFVLKQMTIAVPGQPEKKILWGYDDMCIRFFKGEKLKLVIPCNHHRGGFVSCMAISENGEYVVTGGTDSLICVFNLNWTHNRPRFTLTKETLPSSRFVGHNFPITSVDISSGFSTVISSDTCGQVLAWDLVTMSFTHCIFSPIWNSSENFNAEPNFEENRPIDTVSRDSKRIADDQSVVDLKDASGQPFLKTEWAKLLKCQNIMSNFKASSLWNPSLSSFFSPNNRVLTKINPQTGDILIVHNGLITIKDINGVPLVQQTISQNIPITAFVNTTSSDWMDHVNFYIFGLQDGTIKVYMPNTDPHPSPVMRACHYGPRIPSPVKKLIFHTTLQKVHSCAIIELKIDPNEKILYSGDEMGNIYKWEDPRNHED